MTTTARATLLLIGLLTSAALPSFGAEGGPNLDELQGKWSTSRTNREGQAYSMILDIKKDRLELDLRDAEGKTRMVATSTLKVEKAGPFQVLTLANIEGGRSRDDMSPVDDTRTMVYTLRDGLLYMASNFDRDRGNEKPGTDIYTKVSSTTPAAGSGNATGGEDKVLGTWKIEVVTGDTTRDYELRLSKSEGQIKGVLVSPRSGERPCQSVTFKDGELVVEVIREMQGNEVTMVYRAKLDGQKLTGRSFAKGAEDQWKAEVRGTR